MKRKPNLITKTEIARRLHEMVDERLFDTDASAVIANPDTITKVFGRAVRAGS
jgi:hypothetical protein